MQISLNLSHGDFSSPLKLFMFFTFVNVHDLSVHLPYDVHQASLFQDSD